MMRWSIFSLRQQAAEAAFKEHQAQRPRGSAVEDLVWATRGPTPPWWKQQWLSARRSFKEKLQRYAKGCQAFNRRCLERVDDVVISRVEDPYGFESVRFTIGLAVILSLHSMSVGLELSNEGDLSAACGVVNYSFLVLYMVEVFFRCHTIGVRMMSNYQRMDCLLSVLAFFEKFWGATYWLSSAPVVRLVGVLLKLGRIQKMLHDQRTMQMVIAAVFRLRVIMGWSLFVVCLTMWSWAVVAHIVIGESNEWGDGSDPREYQEPFEYFDKAVYFGDVSRSFMTLLQIATLADWADTARTIGKAYPLTLIFFMVFILLVSYSLMVAVTAEVLTEVLWSARRLEKAAAEIRHEQRKALSNKILEVLELVDDNNDGQLSAEEIDKALAQDHDKEGTDAVAVRELLLELGVPSHIIDGESLVRMLDTTGDGLITYAEFRDRLATMGDELTPEDWVRLEMRCTSTSMRIEVLFRRLKLIQHWVASTRELLESSVESITEFMLDERAENSKMMREAMQYARSARARLPDPPNVVALRKRQGKEKKEREILAAAGNKFMSMVKNLTGSPVTRPATRRSASNPASLTPGRVASSPSSQQWPSPPLGPRPELGAAEAPSPPACPPPQSLPEPPWPPLPAVPHAPDEIEDEEWHAAASMARRARKALLPYDAPVDAKLAQEAAAKHEFDNRSRYRRVHPMAPQPAKLIALRETIGQNSPGVEKNVKRTVASWSANLRRASSAPLGDARPHSSKVVPLKAKKRIIDYR